MDNYPKSVSFVKFDYVNNVTEETSLTCNVQFIAQTPDDPTAMLTTRAILVCFSAKDAEDRVHLDTKIRVIFSFDKASEVPAEDVFLQKYCRAAYFAFKEKIQNTLKIMDITGFSFPDDINV